MQVLKHARIEDQEVRIVQDDLDDSPRDWDNLGKIVCWHERYSLPNEGHFDTPDAFHKFMKENKDKILVLPIYMYDHSGIAISITRDYPFNDKWDAGQVGYIYATYKDLMKEYDIKRLTKKTLDKARNVLIGEIETFDQYLRGDVYGFILVKLATCNLGQEHKEIIDSCYGFYGSDLEKSGILDCLEDKWKTATWVNGE